MHVTLPESTPRRKRSTVGALASVVLHALAIGAAVVSTGMSGPVSSMTEQVDTLVYHPPVPPPAPVERVAGGGLAYGGTPPAIPAPSLDIRGPEVPSLDLAIGAQEAAQDFSRSDFSTGVVAPARAVDDVARPFDEATVEKAVTARAGNPEPRYPTLLSRAGIEGSVAVRFVVDTSGAVEVQSVTILSATHEQFARSVREALPRMRFVPAEVAGRKVRQLVEQRFGFELRHP
jgi:protein TonB